MVTAETDPGVVIDGDCVSRMAGAVLNKLPKGCHYSAIHKSLLPLVGKLPDHKELRDKCWSIAANIPALKSGQSVSTAIPVSKTPVVIQFLAASRIGQRRVGKGFPVRYRARVIIGPSAPTVLEFVWSSAYVQYLATRPDGFGFAGRVTLNKPTKGRAYQHHTLLVGMRTVVVISIQDFKLKVDGFKCTSSLRKYNESLTEMRWRNGFTCPYNYTHPCQQCHHGQTDCPAAVRPLTLIRKVCDVCGKDENHDPVWSTKNCMNCTQNRRRRDNAN